MSGLPKKLTLENGKVVVIGPKADNEHHPGDDHTQTKVGGEVSNSEEAEATDPIWDESLEPQVTGQTMMRECEQELLRSIQALAQSSECQQSLYPEFVNVADELVLDFDHALEVARAEVGSHWSLCQREALEALDKEIAALSGPEHPEVWEAPECLSHPAWSVLRRLAADVLSAFGWSNQPPAPSKAIYVGTPDSSPRAE